MIESSGKSQKAAVRLDEKASMAVLTVPDPISIARRIRISYTAT